MMGDLNARHTQFDDHSSNHYGNELIRFCDRTGFERVKPRTGQWTFLAEGRKSIVDHVLCNEAALQYGAWCRVEEDLFVGATDHSLIKGELSRPVAPQPSGGEIPRPWNRRRLHDPEVRERFNAQLNLGLEQLVQDIDRMCADESLPAQHRADRLYDLFMAWMDEAMRKEVGRVRRRSRPDDFMTSDLAIKEGRLEDARRALLRLPVDDVGTYLAKLDYQEAKKTLESAICKRKEAKFREFAEGLRTMELPEQLRLIHSIKNSRQRAGGGLLKSDPRRLAEYREHFARQYANRNESPLGPEAAPPHFDQICPSPFCPETIRLHLRAAPAGKATGNSGLPMEALKAAGEVVELPLALLFNFFWKHAVVPQAWCFARIQPVPKKGDLTKISNYRPISLTDVLRRLYETVMLGMVNASIGRLSLEQGGFRHRRGTIDQIAVLQEWALQAKAEKRARYMAFLDIKAAYDQVDRAILWKKLAAKGMPKNLLEVLQALFDNNTSAVAVEGSQSAGFQLESGLLQGSPISPVLYSVFIDDLVDDLNSLVGEDRMLVGGRRLRCLLYADDIVLLSTSESDLHQLLQICEEHSFRNRYRFGVRKCEVVTSRNLSAEATIYGETLQVSEVFTYLGVPIRADGIDWHLHFTRIGAKALAAAHFFKSLGCNGMGFDLITSLRIYRSFVRPVMEYCLCLSPLRYAKLVDRWYGRCLKVMTSMPTATSHAAIGMFSELHPALVRMKKLQFKFAMRSRGRGEEFGMHFALKAFRGRALKNSVFASWSTNEILVKRDAARNHAVLTRSEPQLPPVDDILDELLDHSLQSLSSCFIFRGSTHGKRKKWRKNFSLLGRSEQRQILLWVCNLSAGKWKLCRHCLLERATKGHLERCVFRGFRFASRGGPSWTEERLREAEDPISLLGLVTAIETMVGGRTTNGFCTEPP